MFTEIKIKYNNFQWSEKSFVSGEVENMTRLKVERIIIQSCGCWSQRDVKTHRPYRTWDIVSRNASRIEQIS
jgi:hypothetical protein